MATDQNGNGGNQSTNGGNQGTSGGSNSGTSQVPNPFDFLDLQTESYDPRKDDGKIIIEKKEKR